jgi:hypothetical protein
MPAMTAVDEDQTVMVDDNDRSDMVAEGKQRWGHDHAKVVHESRQIS